MNTKRITVILISVAFGLVVLFSCIGLLAIKKIDVNYAVSANTKDTDAVQKTLDNFLGKNLLFLDVDEVVESIGNKPYLEVVSIEKKFPNVLQMNVKERKETYRIVENGTTYILDENGVVLNNTGELKQGTDIIDLAFIAFENNPDSNLKIKITSAVLGQKLKTSNDKVVYETIKVAKQVGLADCIEKISIEDCTNGYDVYFETCTGVKICVVDVMEDGVRKALTAFNVYDTVASDYQKRFGAIQSLYVGDELVVQHIYDDIDPSDRDDKLLHSEDK